MIVSKIVDIYDDDNAGILNFDEMDNIVHEKMVEVFQKYNLKLPTMK